MKTYLICTLILWVFGILQNMRELSQKSPGSPHGAIIAASLVQLLLIIWATHLLSNLSVNL
jgi:hypothetical protein